MPFSDLIGNSGAKAALQRMIEHQCVPNTLLFYGPEGVGKSLFAKALCASLMGSSKLDNHPDLHIYYPEGKAHLHPVENMRQLISEMSLPPYSAPVKVFILHDADRMQSYSSNALLKTFEEPNSDTYFILLTSSLDAILPTILSRSRTVPFFPIPQNQLETFVQNKWKKTPSEARRIAFLSHGSLAKAQLLSAATQLPWRSALMELLTLHLPRDYPQFQKIALQIENNCLSEEAGDTSILTQTDALFEEIVAWYRDLHLLKMGVASEYLYHLDSLDKLKLSMSLPIPPLEKVLEQIAVSRLSLQRNIKLRHVLENLLLNLM